MTDATDMIGMFDVGSDYHRPSKEEKKKERTETRNDLLVQAAQEGRPINVPAANAAVREMERREADSEAAETREVFRGLSNFVGVVGGLLTTITGGPVLGVTVGLASRRAIRLIGRLYE